MQLHTLLKSWVTLNTRRPFHVAFTFIAFVIGSVWISSHLKLNTNQLDLLNPEMRFIQDIRRVDEMIGGAGQLTVAFKGDNPEQLKQVAQDLSQYLLTELKSDIREARYRMPVEFVKKNAALFMQSEDLLELKRRVMLKIKDAQKRADPFFFEITPTDPVQLDLDDLIQKYSTVGKKSIQDDYYMSADKRMQLLFVKPVWGSNMLEKTGTLVKKIETWLAKYRGKEGEVSCLALSMKHQGKGVKSKNTVMFGFTGTYKSNYDDSFQISESLLPVSGIALLGVFLVLLAFFRKNIFAIFLILSGLLFGLVFTFAWATVWIGELNMITSILGGILMGLGIDFGIHFLYRLREEMVEETDLSVALVKTITGAGSASVFSGLGSMAAFASLLTSDFKGFSQFGFLAGSGVFLIGLSIYIWVPAVLLCLDKYKVGKVRHLMRADTPVVTSKSTGTHLANPHWILIIGSIICALLISYAPQVPFEYNTRALMVEGLPSVQLQDEIKQHFNIGSDPVAIYTPTLKKARRVYEFFKQKSVNVGLQSQQQNHSTQFKTIDQVLSLYTFVPPKVQQAENFKILHQWNQELSKIPVKSLPPELQERWQEGLSYLKATPFTIKDLPKVYSQNFTHLPESDPKVHGYLTFVYAGVDLWDGKNMLAFAREVEELKVDGQSFYSAGMPILFSYLTRIILNDARFTVFLTSILLCLILLLDFRRIGYTLIALTPLLVGVGSMLGVMSLIGAHLNLMNMVVFPIIIGYGVSHAVYFLHRIQDGQTVMQALSSVGKAIACSTLTTLAGWAALLVASHRGLQSMGTLACLGMLATLMISLTLMPALLELLSRKKELKTNPSKILNIPH